jgi:Flp pilus assembly pilin Flp
LWGGVGWSFQKGERWIIRKCKAMIDDLVSHRGQAMLEYAFVIVLIAVIVISVLTAFGSAVGNIFSNIVANI